MQRERREPFDVRWMRRCLNHWPFRRGQGLLMRLFRPLLGNRSFLMELEPGILVPGRLDEYVLLWAFVHGYARDPAVRLSRALILPGDTVVDVGANLGCWLMGAALRAGPSGSVHAFEPVPDTFARLIAHLEMNDLVGVHCQQLALTDRSGNTRLFVSRSGNSALASLASRDGVDEPVDVELTTLDAYLSANGISRVHFLKVDVEGAELGVFRGATVVLSTSDGPAILFEADDSLATPFGSSCRVVKLFLAQHGYRIYRYSGNRLIPVDVEEDHEHEDLFALKPCHFDRYSFLRRLVDSPLRGST